MSEILGLSYFKFPASLFIPINVIISLSFHGFHAHLFFQAKSLEKMNCEVDKNLWFVTTKDVSAGQELVTHYGFEFWVHRPLVTDTEAASTSSLKMTPQSMLLFYALHEQSSKPFNLRQFFDYVSFLIHPDPFTLLLKENCNCWEGIFWAEKNSSSRLVSNNHCDLSENIIINMYLLLSISH